MALVKKTLEDAIKAIPKTEGQPPAANQAAAQEFAKALEKYFKDGMAGAARVTLTFSTLTPILKPTMDANNFIQKLGTSIQSWSATWAWAGGGMVGAPGTTVAVGASLDGQLTAFVNAAVNDKTDPPKDNIPELANKIHTWAKTIIVNLVNSGGTTVPTPVA